MVKTITKQCKKNILTSIPRRKNISLPTYKILLINRITALDREINKYEQAKQQHQSKLKQISKLIEQQ